MKKEDLGHVDRIVGEIHTEDMEIRHVLEKEFIQPLIGTTPTVLNRKVFELNNTAPVTITDFMNGAVGQRIYILGDGQTTIANNATIKTSTGVNKLLLTNQVYVFTFFGLAGPPSSHKWVEDSDITGSGGSLLSPVHVNRTAGNLTISATSYTVVSASLDLTLAAVVGDVLSISIAGIYQNQAGQAQMDVVTLVGGVHTNFISGSTNTGFGIQACRGLPVSTSKPFSATILYTVVVGDIVAGNVTLRLVAKVPGSTRVIAATSDEPFSFGAVNLRQ